MRRRARTTPAGSHLPVLVNEVLAALDAKPGETAVDCTTGHAGHACALLRRTGPAGKLVCLDLDPENLRRAEEKLSAIGHPYEAHHLNFAGVAGVLRGEGVDCLLADLGMSSMQVDDAERGFSYRRDGPLDMRMDRTRGRTAAELLAQIEPAELAEALRELGDEEKAARLAPALCKAAREGRIARTGDLVKVIEETLGVKDWKLRRGEAKWETHPAAKTFQVLRILVNRELANLTQLLRVLPSVLKPGGRAAIISFHSGEDRLVKQAFKEGLRAEVYEAISEEPVRATFAERQGNPRSRSAKLRWARRVTEQGA
ncbi:MAG: 16S rRNA (cytosine(1402)-N(4))-methyltransferase RsmH [Gemmataceae bacterium]|nr:16S rRNA (cytosine(1402)-N(4))-methyltransferase RsmH [Gemmataceae bacterium]